MVETVLKSHIEFNISLLFGIILDLKYNGNRNKFVEPEKLTRSN